MRQRRLKIAIQKNGRLTEGSLHFLKSLNLDLNKPDNQLVHHCQNYPLDIFYVRDDDIITYVKYKAVDLGIVGENLLSERLDRVRILSKLNFGFCSLQVAVPKDSRIQTIEKLSGLTIATSYPKLTTLFFRKRNIPVHVLKVAGSSEVTINLGLADAIAEVVSTGKTLNLHNLIPIQKILDSQAILISSINTDHEKQLLIDQLLEHE
ncbi:MAG: ATP phosphoribosyltransferase [Candidatus Daviesbacteria bacterium GW2011_GWA2_38_24]|uniref:ATP phosphoribosyltransferase n=1 Tax=Candidatus Daviesbacteria bacterium GW2011_GWA2_38_24 TaxID=1618422 RepID=A0A0G0JW27_9BACT|nr:MAG: ATP phosphoribosyltransferase [Candidatus Daviesbacteria bacterium GW2011_GWA2_38_24]KKQ79749.1 MAG: ATP phosphoribosyltransferase [Candidatus Daviesbacteria bacterium GW2011_GWA1_38_7]OGE24456.1 MAG: ATP phosphoribosyltransferase [Candidatus Daviesbacteria bacterium RIFCSPHIGHO2_01_FULL_38_8]